MDWINDVPVPIQGLPDLSWGVIIWVTMFLIAGVYFVRLAGISWASYRYVVVNGNEEAIRLFALGRVLVQIDSLLIVVAGVLIGIFSAANSQALSRHFTVREGIVILLLFSIPVLKIVQAIFTEQINQSVSKALNIKEAK